MTLWGRWSTENCVNERDLQNYVGFSDTKRSPNLGQMARPNDN